MISLEDAIAHCEEVAEAEERSAKLHQRPDKGIKGSGKRYLSCLECAKEHRQLAEWLRELKAYREELPKEIKNVKVRQADALEANVKNETYNSHLAEYIKGYICALSCTEGIIAKIREKVNADES